MSEAETSRRVHELARHEVRKGLFLFVPLLVCLISLLVQLSGGNQVENYRIWLIDFGASYAISPTQAFMSGILAIYAIYASSVFLGLLPFAAMRALNQPLVTSIILQCWDMLFIGKCVYRAWHLRGPYVVYTICTDALSMLGVYVVQWPLSQTPLALGVATTLGSIASMASQLVSTGPSPRVDAQLRKFVVVVVVNLARIAVTAIFVRIRLRVHLRRLVSPVLPSDNFADIVVPAHVYGREEGAFVGAIGGEFVESLEGGENFVDGPSHWLRQPSGGSMPSVGSSCALLLQAKGPSQELSAPPPPAANVPLTAESVCEGGQQYQRITRVSHDDRSARSPSREETREHDDAMPLHSIPKVILKLS